MKRLFKIEDFDARQIGRRHVVLYPMKRDRFLTIDIFLPGPEVSMKTGKPTLDLGRVSAGSSSSYHKTLKRTIRFGRAIIAAAGYLHEQRMEARGVPK